MIEGGRTIEEEEFLVDHILKEASDEEFFRISNIFESEKKYREKYITKPKSNILAIRLLGVLRYVIPIVVLDTKFHPNAINLSLEYDTYTFVNDSHFMNAAKNTNLSVIGILKPSKFVDWSNPRSFSPESMNFETIIFGKNVIEDIKYIENTIMAVERVVKDKKDLFLKDIEPSENVVIPNLKHKKPENKFIEKVEGSMNMKFPHNEEDIYKTLRNLNILDEYKVYEKTKDVSVIDDFLNNMESINNLGKISKVKEHIRMEESSKNNISNSKFNKIYRELSAKEKTVVDNIFSKNAKYAKNYRQNNCKHFEIWKKLISTDNVETFEELMKFFKKDKSSNDSMLRCDVCGFESLCPHYIRKYSLMKDNKKDYVNSKLKEEFSEGHVNGSSYCNICGEILSKELVLDEGDRTKGLSQQDELAKIIRSNTYQIVNRYVNTGVIRVHEISDYVMFKIYNAVDKHKTKYKIDIDSKELQYIVNVYIFAVVVNIIVLYEKDLSLKGVKNIIVKKNMPTITRISFQAIELLQSHIQSLITLLNKSTDVLKYDFTKAFNAIGEDNIQFNQTDKKHGKLVINDFTNNNTFVDFIVYMNNKHGKGKITKEDVTTKNYMDILDKANGHKLFKDNMLLMNIPYLESVGFGHSLEYTKWLEESTKELKESKEQVLNSRELVGIRNLNYNKDNQEFKRKNYSLSTYISKKGKLKPVTEVLNSKPESITDDKIRISYDNMSNLENFYRHFSVLCPKGKSHDYEKSKCKKCGITDELLQTLDTEYFNKFNPVFEKYKKRKQLVYKENKSPSTTSSIIVKKVKFDGNTNEIVTYSKKNGFKLPSILNLGGKTGFTQEETDKDLVEVKSRIQQIHIILMYINIISSKISKPIETPLLKDLRKDPENAVIHLIKLVIKNSNRELMTEIIDLDNKTTIANKSEIYRNIRAKTMEDKVKKEGTRGMNDKLNEWDEEFNQSSGFDN